ncbi:Mus7/MMS22 family-domain-containing protein [Mycena polygramma]|nr:Mus7/MMS22 family-domain-containing protein [Mycena polygramma]
MDEVVETSDPEELEELRSAHAILRPQIRPPSIDGRQSPRKRPKLNHEYSDLNPRTPPRSRSSSSDAPSLGFQSASEYTSPVSLTRDSSPKPSSPVATPPISIIHPSVSPAVAEDPRELPFTQDPLLLGGTVSPKPHILLPDSVSRLSPSSPLQIEYDESGSPILTEPNLPNTPSRSRRSRSESADPLLLFTPSRPSISGEAARTPDSKVDDVDRASQFSSPLPPLSPERSVVQHPESPARRISPRPPASPLAHPGDVGIAQALANEPGRWSFRPRNLAQKKPFTFEKVQYEDSMKGIPEAIIKFRDHSRHHQAHEAAYEDVQTQELEADFGSDDRAERRRRSNSKSPRRIPPENLGLPSLPSSDESGSTDSVRRDARRAQKEQKRDTKRKRGRKIPKPFPLRPTDDSDDEDRHSPSRLTNRPHSTAGRAAQKSPSHGSRHRTSQSPASPKDLRASSPCPRTPVFQNTRSNSPPVLFHNDSDVDMDFVGHFSPPPHSQRSGHGTPIVISDDEDNRSANETAEEVELSKEEKKQRRRIRALNRMYPAFMRDRMMQGAAPAKAAMRRQRSATLSSASDEEQPLLPGQTRVRRADNPRDLRDVKGDTESSDDQLVMATRDALDSDEGPAASDSDVEVVWPRKHRARDNAWSSDEELLSDGRIDDERIEAYLKEAPVRGSGLQEKDMIDWMLANTAHVGGTRPPRTRVKSTTKTARSEGSRRPKISVTIGGARRERQTLLSFDKPPARRSRNSQRSHSPQSNAEAGPSAPREPRKRAAGRQIVLLVDSPTSETRNRPRRDRSSHSSPERRFADDAPLSRVDDAPPSPSPDPENIDVIVHNIPDPEALRKAARRQKEKEKRARMKMQGIHVFIAPKGSHIVGQRSKTIAINVADRGFHRALAPVNSAKPRQAKRPSTSNLPRVQTKAAPRSSAAGVKRRLLPRGDRPGAAVSDAELDTREGPEAMEESDEDAKAPDSDTADVDEQALLLDFGIPSPPKVTLGSQTYSRSKLYALLHLQSEPVRPGFYSAHGFDLGPNISTQEFLDVFSSICDRFFEFATGLPEEDDGQQAKDWMGLTSVACHIVSFLGADKDNEPLKMAVEKQVLCLTSQMRQASLTSTSMDSTTFAICWFAVELAIRAGFRLPANALQAACVLLVEHLLEYGLERGMEPLMFDGEIDGSTTAHRAFEMWVGLWHVADTYRDPGSTISPNPLWKMVEISLTSRSSGETSNLEDSEQAWRAIVSLSIVSQFSDTGQHLQASAIPEAPWNIVHFALSLVRLQADEGIDQTMSASSLDNRDRYIKLLVERCCLLWSRWKWGLKDASVVLYRLIDIFQSRKFTNLRNEKSEFPDFLRVNDWTLLSRPIHSETTYVLFLKLVYQTLLIDPSKIKKLASLAAPRGSLPWNKNRAPSLPELSQLYNRFSAIAIAIYFDPAHHTHWLGLARECVKFKDADPTTRIAHIRGLMYLSIVMVQRDVQLDASVGWLDEMVSVLLDEHKHEPEPKVVLGIHALVVSVRNVIRAFKGTKRYPEPRLLLSLERILRDTSLVNETNASAHMLPRLIRSFLAARASAVPEPRRPVIPDQESQDEYGAYAYDQDMLAAFDQADQPEYIAKDQSLHRFLTASLIWPLSRQLVQNLKAPSLKASFKRNNRVGTDIAILTGCWLGCGQIIIQTSQESAANPWSKFLGTYKDGNSKWPKNLDKFCERRVDFLIYSNILKLDPMSYLTMQDTFLIVFFQSLASWHNASEDEYIQLLLSIDGSQHSLLRGVEWEPFVPKDGRAYNIEILTARLPLVTAILENLNDRLTVPMDMDAEDNKKYIGYCNKMLSAMQDVHNELEAVKPAQESYTSWCSRVYREFQNYPLIAGDASLHLQMALGKRLSTNVL